MKNVIIMGRRSALLSRELRARLGELLLMDMATQLNIITIDSYKDDTLCPALATSESANGSNRHGPARKGKGGKIKRW